MGDFALSPRAQNDLRDIWQSIATDNPRAADALFMKIMDKIALAATQPLMGSLRPELSTTARVLIHGNYMIIYEPAGDDIHVLAVVHGARDMGRWL